MVTWTEYDLLNYQTRSQTSCAQPEPPVQDDALGPDQGEAPHPARIAIRITSYRQELIDPDNFCPKYFIDSLRYAGIIPDDRPEDISIEQIQKKVALRSDERTEIEITGMTDHRGA